MFKQAVNAFARFLRIRVVPIVAAYAEALLDECAEFMLTWEECCDMMPFVALLLLAALVGALLAT